jgi:uncharacterized membrane protein YfcA
LAFISTHLFASHLTFQAVENELNVKVFIALGLFFVMGSLFLVLFQNKKPIQQLAIFLTILLLSAIYYSLQSLWIRYGISEQLNYLPFEMVEFLVLISPAMLGGWIFAWGIVKLSHHFSAQS